MLLPEASLRNLTEMGAVRRDELCSQPGDEIQPACVFGDGEGAVDFAHCSGAEAFDDFVIADEIASC